MAKAATKTKTDGGPDEVVAPESEPVATATVVSKATVVEGGKPEVDSKPEVNDNLPAWENRPRTIDEGLSAIQFTEFMRFPESHTVWRVDAKGDHRAIDTLQPEYLWSIAGDRIRPGDIVQCTNKDYAYLVELLIVKRRPEIKGFEFHIISLREFSKERLIKPNLSDATVELKGGAAKWCVLRRGEILRPGFESEAMAEAWLARERLI